MNEFYVHNIDPFLIRFPFGFSLGPIEGIPWYGTMYGLGFFVGFWLLKKLRREGFVPFKDDKQIEDFFTYIVIGVLLGGRAGHIFFYQIDIILDNPLRFFAVWEGGMASHGGIIGVVLAIYFYCKKHNIPFYNIGDGIALITPPALGFGRIANFINGEMPGTQTDVSWAVIFPKFDAALGLQNIPRHPSQIYQALGEGLFLYLLLWFVMPRNKFQRGFISSMFVIFYGLQRIVTETFREGSDTLSSMFTFLTQGQLLSIFMILIGALMLYNSQKKHAEV